MFTQCPECMTVFAVDATTLARAHGCVGCSQCGATFDTMATLCDALPEEPFESLPINEPGAAPPLLLESVAHEKPPQQGLFDTTDDVPGDAGAAHRETGLEPDRDEYGTAHGLPSFARQDRHRSRGSRRLAWACAALSVVLVAQLAWAERSTLVRSPALASLMRSACDTLGCSLPMARDVQKLELTSRDIRRHPSVEGALLISATVRNNADFRQPWPVIGISLSNLDDQKLAMRRFRPTEYLHDAATRRAGLAPGASAALVFEVADPGRDAVAFEFSFR